MAGKKTKRSPSITHSTAGPNANFRPPTETAPECCCRGGGAGVSVSAPVLWDGFGRRRRLAVTLFSLLGQTPERPMMIDSESKHYRKNANLRARASAGRSPELSAELEPHSIPRASPEPSTASDEPCGWRPWRGEEDRQVWHLACGDPLSASVFA